VDGVSGMKLCIICNEYQCEDYDELGIGHRIAVCTSCRREHLPRLIGKMVYDFMRLHKYKEAVEIGEMLKADIRMRIEKEILARFHTQ
jgi:hypothetical protein